jgi:transcription elongation factor GreA
VRRIISEDGERDLRAQLARLRQQLEVEFPARLHEAREFGDVGENDDYLQIKEEEAVLAARIYQLEALLGSATTTEPPRRRGVVSIGSVVELQDLGSGVLRDHRLTGGFENAGDISANSPIGRALLGHKRGDEVTVELPGGRAAAFRITAVRAPRR